MPLHRLPSSVFRLTALLFLIAGACEALASAQQTVSPLPPPVTRHLYRSRWFEFLNAHLEDDTRAAGLALVELRKAAQAVGIHRLSDFARTAAYEGRRAEGQGRYERADRAYDAALILDDANCDARFERIEMLLRHRLPGKAVAALPAALKSVVATGESRLAAVSAILLWAAAGVAAAMLGSILILLARHARVASHDLEELASRFFGRGASVPLALIVLLLPLGFGLGPVWVVLYWGALIYASSLRAERIVFAVALTVFGLIPFLAAMISRENILERSPLYVAALDLSERREDASAEDGLRQAAAAHAEDSDIWLLLGTFAERSADPERALSYYERAIREAPADYRPLLNRGNIQYQEGNFEQAVRDYEAAAQRASAPEIYYNLALARAESYDFQGQGEALQKARRISARSVEYWIDHPTLGRVVPASYPLSRARRKIGEWSAREKGRRLPGEVSASRLVEAFASPFALGPWALLVLALGLTLSGRLGVAAECPQCSRAYCRFCKRSGKSPGSCSTCGQPRKASRGIDGHLRQAEEGRRLARRSNRACRLLSLVLPGAHRYFSNKPVSGFLTLFLFFFLLSTAAINSRLVEPRLLGPAGSPGGLSIGALAAAMFVWASSLRSSWKHSHGT